jgi:AraC-like DNA-binding protein
MPVSTVSLPKARLYSTDRSVNRIRDWERHNAESLIALSCDVPKEEFQALEVNLDLPHVSLAYVRGTAHGVARSGDQIERQPVRSVAVYASLRGQATFAQAGRQRHVRPGQLLVCNPDQPFMRVFGDGLAELAVTVPWPRIEAAAGFGALPAPIVVDGGRGGDPYGAALVRLVGSALRPEAAIPAHEELVVELIAMMIAGDRASLTLAHRAAAKAYIEEHLADPGLSATEVAVATCISERHLSRVFAEAGQSVPQYILARRLDAAHGRLTSRAAARLRTVDVAQACGFTSSAYFSQSFRKRFGQTAGAVRRSTGEVPISATTG